MRHFLRGLLLVAPIGITVYVVWVVVVTLDRWLNVDWLLNRNVPGAGLVLTVVLITLVGVLAGSLGTRWLFGLIDELLTRLPFVKLVYTSLRDLFEAFVGDKKRFDRPVLVTLGEEGGVCVPGFLTREDLGELGLRDQVAVYFPQSYNFAGNLLIVSRDRVRPLALDGGAAMAFIVSGGVSGELGPSGDARA